MSSAFDQAKFIQWIRRLILEDVTGHLLAASKLPSRSWLNRSSSACTRCATMANVASASREGTVASRIASTTSPPRVTAAWIRLQGRLEPAVVASQIRRPLRRRGLAAHRQGVGSALHVGSTTAARAVCGCRCRLPATSAYGGRARAARSIQLKTNDGIRLHACGDYILQALDAGESAQQTRDKVWKRWPVFASRGLLITAAVIRLQPCDTSGSCHALRCQRLARGHCGFEHRIHDITIP